MTYRKSWLIIALCWLVAGCQSLPTQPPLRYRVMTMKYGVNKQLPDDVRCQRFQLSPADVVNYFEHAQAVNPSIFRQYAKGSSCYYQGSLMVDGDIQQWMITAAGVGYLSRGLTKNELRHFLCTKNCHQVFGSRFQSYELDE
ncbi:hypothetical protein [Celerinatantimonas yamalensis]|uniref:Uncharacterized protein n=1 Tax=Celerinatantimonas yamalensis TaxID=559956 RepID=A0ABW9G4X2_9GAMM